VQQGNDKGIRLIFSFIFIGPILIKQKEFNAEEKRDSGVRCTPYQIKSEVSK
jgi:hypothetical protein